MSAAAADSSPPLTATAGTADDYCGSADSPASTIVGKVERGCYNVRVDGYSKTKETRNGSYVSYLASTDFVVGGQPWRIKYYPNGYNQSSTGQVSIYVARVGGVDVVLHADVQIDLVARHGYSAAAPPETEFAGRYRYTFLPDSSFGFPCFISTEKLDKSPCIKDDGFTIRCDITVEGPPFVVAVKPSSALGWHLGDLLGDTETADVAVDVGVGGGEKTTFAAHRYVLAARSLVFKAQLFGPLKVDNGAAIRVDDMRADVFRAFLHFIYTDELPPGVIDGNDNDEAAIMAQHLLVAADKYDLPRLKLICESKLSKSLDVGTAATTLALAEQHGCHDLKEVVLRFIKLPSNMEAVKCSDGFKHLLESCPSIHQDLKSRHILS
ncbi:BTB/POZ and MATH domain-containing protein 2-like [Oryza glaberrima]|uniref:BTB/POZ and MATH domain-containing protein 2-like n=1 Tax=Oryza glaberrima TaxID=4538 RepID=UPI00224C4270|nr:BTB/POZ and MATH domain-containing protein 2-like [Oryza glaberrima]